MMSNFIDIYNKYFKYVYSISYRMIGKHDDAMDVTQEVFFRVYKALSRIKDESTVKSYIYRITINESLRWLNKNKKFSLSEVSMEKEGMKNELISDELSPFEFTVSEEIKDRLNQILQNLPPNYRAIIVLYYQEGLKIAEIADYLKKPEGTIKVYLQRAKAIIKNKLQEGHK